MANGAAFRLLPPAAAVLLVCACSLHPFPGHLSTCTLYPAPAAEPAVPSGMVPVFVETLGRHGSRYATSSKTLERMLATLEYARTRGALKRKGLELEAAVRRTIAVSDFGQITSLAVSQQQGIARRMYAADKVLFDPRSGRKIYAVATSKKRTQDTRDAFLGELAELAGYDSSKDFVSWVSTGCQPLRFFDCDAEYREYKESAVWRHTPYYASMGGRTEELSRRLLSGFLSVDFIKRLNEGKAPGNAYASPQDMAAGLYDIYSMDRNLPDSVYDFGGLFTDAQLAWLEYMDDYESFYEKGPGGPGSNITFGMAGELLRDFVEAAERAAADPAGSPAAVLRFAHAETVMPLAAIMRLKGASEQQGEYAFEGRLWKSAEVAPMSANIRWTLYRGVEGYKLEIMLNERPVLIDAPLAHDGYLYDWPEIRKFYLEGGKGAGS